MAVEFTPTRTYLPRYYENCEDMLLICDVLDKLYFSKYYADVCIKSQVYFLFRNDLATETTEDTAYENALNTTLGISGAWASTDTGAFPKIFTEDWPQRRICAWLLMTQLVSRPSYTWSDVDGFVRAIEQLFHPADVKETDHWMSVSNDANVGKNVVYITLNTKHIRQAAAPYFEHLFHDVCSLIRAVIPMNIYSLPDVVK